MKKNQTPEKITQLNEETVKTLEGRFYIPENDFNKTVNFLFAHYAESTKELTLKDRVQIIKTQVEYLERVV